MINKLHLTRSLTRSLAFAALAIFMILPGLGWGQATLLHFDALNYTVGQSLTTQTGWTLVNTSTSDMLITTGNLSYTGLPTSSGNKVAFSGAGEDVAKLFTQQTSGTVYYSFLLNVTSLGSLTATGGYFTGLNEGTTTTYGGTVWTRLNGVGYDIGINPRTTAANTVWSGIQTVNSTLFIVISYQIVSGTLNDVVKMWINPTPGGTEPSATLSATNSLTDLANLNRILIRQDATTATPTIEMDELRVGTTWASVTPAAAVATISAPSPTSLTGFSTTAGAVSASQTFTVGGTNLTANLVVTVPTNYEVRENGTGTFGTSVSFVPSSGTVATKTIEVRIAASAPVGSPSGNVTCTSTGATTQNVAVSGTVIAAASVTIDGTIAAGEYGTHTNGSNQQSSTTGTWYMSWDATNLYIGVAGTNTAEGAILYLDKNPIVPVNGGANSDGTLTGNTYDGSSFANLQFRSDLVVYFKDGYKEYRTADGSNGWSAPTTSFGSYASTSGSTGTKEIAIPWSAIGGQPSAFNWFGYVAYTGGGAYASVPTENPGSGAGSIIGSAARWDRYYTVSTTSTLPFSRNSYVFTSASDANNFGTIDCYDFTLNSNNWISRTGGATGAWNIAGNLNQAQGNIYLGSGANATNITGKLNMLGGYFDMGTVTSPITVTGDVPIASGATLKLSGTASGDLNIAGNWSNLGTFTCNGRQVTFNGVLAQTLTGTNTFDYLKLNNVLGLTLQASSPVTVNTNLDLTSGKISLGANNLTMGSAASFSNQSASNYIVTNSTGALVRNSVGNTATPFPVGLAASYTPLTVTNTGTGNNLSLVVTSPPSNAVSDATKIVNLEWNLNSTGAGSTCNIIFNWNTGNQGASYSTSGTGELGNYTSGPNYAITSIGTMAGQTKTVTGIALTSGNNKLVLGNTGAVYLVPPSNDNCAGATALTLDAVAVTGNVTNATLSLAATCAGTADDDVWYSFTTSAAGNYSITVIGSASFDAVVDLRSGVCNGTNIACADITASGGTETITSALSASTTYLVRVYSYGSSVPATTTFTIAVASPPATLSTNSTTNLAFATNQAVLSNSASQTFNLSGAFLTGAPGNITVSAPNTNFQVSNNDASWGPTATISYSSATLASTPVYVRFTPQTAGAKTGNITFSGGGVSSPPTIALTGTGILTAPGVSAATNITSTAFDANWSSVIGASSGYLLDVSASATFGAPGPATLTEGFESGMPTSYTTGTATLTSGIWSLTRATRGTAGVNAGSYSAQLESSTGSQLISPSLPSGVTTISFWVTSSTTSGGLQVNYSTDGGSSWTPAPGSPFTGLGTSKVQKTISLNNTAAATLIQFYRTAATIYIDDVSIGYTTTVPSFVTGYNAKAIAGQATVTSNVTITGGLSSNTNYYYRLRATDGVTPSAYSGNITVLTAPAAFAVTGGGSYCQGSGGLAVGLAGSQTGVNYQLYVGGTTTVGSPVAGTGSAITFGSQTAGTYTVKGTNAGGTTDMTGSAVVTENPQPSPPTVLVPSIIICAGAYISATVGSGETTDWYSDPTGGTRLSIGPANYTPVITGTYYAEARNTTSGCLSATRTGLYVSQINTLPTAVISGIATICEGSSTNLTVNLTGISPWNFTYFDGSTSTVVNSIYSNPAIIAVTPGISKTYTLVSVNGGNSCGGSVSGSSVITVNPAAVPTFTSSPDGTICPNTNVTYTTESGQSNYVWTYPGSTDVTDYSITSGGTSTDNTVTLKWNTSGSKSVGVNYTSANTCAGVIPTLSTVTVELLAPTFTVKPGTSTCANSDVTYTTQAGKTNYAWTYPGSTPGTDYSITSGGGTDENSVTLKWQSTGDKTVNVNYTSAFGCTLTGAPATTSVHVNVSPDAAGAISGTPSVTQGDNGVTYTVGNIANATNYTWAYTGTGATINGTGNNITINFSASATTGDLTVQGLNDCGTGTVSIPYTITVSSPVGPIAYAVTGTGSYCSNDASTLAVGVANSETGVNYVLWKDGTATSSTQPGNTGSPVTFGYQDAGTYTVVGTKTSDNSTTVMTGSAIITAVDPPTAVAGGIPDFAIMGVPYLLSDAAATNYTSVKWLLVTGNGSFSNDAVLQPTFTGTISGQTVTLRLTASNEFCTDAISEVSLVIIPAGNYSKTWTGGGSDAFWNTPANWNTNDGSIPRQTDNVIIPDLAKDPVISNAAVCNDLTIVSGAVLTVASGGSLTVAGILNNTVGTPGLVVKSGGSLIEGTTGIAATIERTIPTSGKWHYISAPNDNTLSDKFAGNFLQSWDESSHAWTYITPTNSKLNPVQGYSLYVKTGTPTYSFTGVINTGTMLYTGLTYTTGSLYGNNGANFLGNPYPSSLDWAGLQGKYGAVYYWNGTGYVSYINGNGGGSQYVPPMQGFFIVANASMITNTGGTFSLSNSNRVHSSPSFYKSASAAKANTLVLATVGESYSDKLYVNFNPEATEGYDLQNDAYKLIAYTPGISELYAFTGDNKLSVDVRPETQAIQLGFTNTKSGEYQIGIDQVADIPVAYLEDTKTGTFHDLLTGPYKFSYTAGESDKRFMLLFGTTGLNETRKTDANIYSYQKTVYVNMVDQIKGDIYIYNISGQQVASKLSAQGMNEFRLQNTGNYIIKVISRNSTVVRKVFIQQ